MGSGLGSEAWGVWELEREEVVLGSAQELVMELVKNH
jgi:hypothetical protein